MFIYLFNFFCHPYFSIRILLSAFCHPHFIIRHPPSAIRHPPPSGLHFTETRHNLRLLLKLKTGNHWLCSVSFSIVVIPSCYLSSLCNCNQKYFLFFDFGIITGNVPTGTPVLIASNKLKTNLIRPIWLNLKKKMSEWTMP